MKADTPIVLHNGMPVPDKIVSNVRRIDQHEVVERWLASLPSVVEQMCSKWGIALDREMPDTFASVVLFGHSTTLGPVVLKSLPFADEFLAQARSLELAAGANVVRLYDADVDHGAMVLERILPGTELAQVAMDDEDSTRLAAELLCSFWRPVSDPAGLRPIRTRVEDVFDWELRQELMPLDLVELAQERASSLLARPSPTYLLHGDFHHYNLLRRASGEWAIIDPNGFVGDRGYEIGRWMMNPADITEREDFAALSARRLAIWSDVSGIDEGELAAWALVSVVLNTMWRGGEAPEWLVRHCTWVAERLRTFVRA